MKAAETRAQRRAEALSKPLRIEPAFASEPDLRFEDGRLCAWFTDPPGAVVQLTEAAPFTKEMAEWVVGPAFGALRARHPDVDGLRMVLDIRPMLSREPAARSVVMHAATTYLFMFTQLGVVAPLKPPPLYMTTLHAAVALLSVIGPEIRVFETIEGALQHLRLQAA